MSKWIKWILLLFDYLQLIDPLNPHRNHIGRAERKIKAKLKERNLSVFLCLLWTYFQCLWLWSWRQLQRLQRQRETEQASIEILHLCPQCSASPMFGKVIKNIPFDTIHCQELECYQSLTYANTCQMNCNWLPGRYHCNILQLYVKGFIESNLRKNQMHT